MLACFSASLLLIYEVPSLQEHVFSGALNYKLSTTALQPLWRLGFVPIQIHQGGLSRPYIFHDVIRFTMCCQVSAHGLTIPRDKTQSPHHFKFMDIPSMFAFSCTYQKIFGKEDLLGSLISLQWSDEADPLSELESGSLVTQTVTDRKNSSYDLDVLLMDEDLARSVSYIEYSILVMDVVKSFRN